MRIVSSICKVFMWITAVLAILFQCMAMWGISVSNAGYAELGKLEEQYNLLPLAIATVALAAAVALFSFLPQRLRFIGLILMGITGVVFIPLALDLGRQFPPYVSSFGEDYGLDTWRVVYRHMMPVLTAVLMAVAWLCDRALYKQEQRRLQEEDKRGHYDLSGGPLFSDERKKKGPAGEKAEIAEVEKNNRWAKYVGRRRQKE